MMKYVAILLTVFNRRDITLKGLRSLMHAINEFNEKEFIFDIYMTDDGCTDGTPEAVHNEFPFINVIKGDGNLYWGGGMNKAWNEAIKNKSYEYYIWFNNDVFLFRNAFDLLFEPIKKLGTNKCVVCGNLCSSDGHFTYGGLNHKHKKILPNGEIQAINFMNGNFVLIPDFIVKKIGIIDKKFKHIKGDYDYGLTVIEQGFTLYTTTDYVGICERNIIGDNRGRKQGVGLFKRFKMLYSSPFIENPNLSFYFNRKHKVNIIKCIALYLKANLTTLLPDLLYSKIVKIINYEHN